MQLNSVENGEFRLNNQTYTLPINNGSNSLHGGSIGFDKHIFAPQSQTDTSVTFQHLSESGDQGYPESITTQITYTLSDMNGLEIMYKSRVLGVLDTCVNLTNHSYFNLDGFEGSVLEHQVLMPDECVLLETNKQQIPTWHKRSLVDTSDPFSFSQSFKSIGESIKDEKVEEFKGFDHYYLKENRPGEFRELVRVRGDRLMMIVSSDASGFQFYTSNWLDGSISQKETQDMNGVYGRHSSFCIETSEPPNAVNSKEFKGRVVIGKGREEYTQTTQFQFEYIGI